VTAVPHFGSLKLTIGTDNKEIISMSGVSGEMSVVARSDHSPTAVFSGTDGRYIFGDERGNLVLLAADGDQVWKFKNGAKISFISRDGSDYLAASFDNFIYKFSRGGNVEWKRRLNGRVASDPIVVDGTAVASTIGGGTVFVLRLKNGKILNQIEGDGDDSGGRVTGAGREAFILTTAKGLSLYSQRCVSK
jgi:outer membrane protein assembly factor BamB